MSMLIRKKRSQSLLMHKKIQMPMQEAKKKQRLTNPITPNALKRVITQTCQQGRDMLMMRIPTSNEESTDSNDNLSKDSSDSDDDSDSSDDSSDSNSSGTLLQKSKHKKPKKTS
eukprot:3289313-Ditylum_brightwellii.AAC.1